MDKQTIDERVQEIICWQQYFPQVESVEECKEEFPNLFKSRMASMSAVSRLGIAAIRQLVLESLPGEKTFISKNPINTPAQIKEIEQEAFTLGHNACLSEIQQKWEPIKA